MTDEEDAILTVRCTTAEKARWTEIAKRMRTPDGRDGNRSLWVRLHLNNAADAADRELEENPPEK